MESNISTEAIRIEIERLSTLIGKWEEERARIDENIAPVRKMRDAYQSIYATQMADAPTVKTSVEAAAPAPSVLAADGGYGARKRTMRKHILASVQLGVTPKTVQEYMASAGLPVSSNFVYKTLGEMKESGEVENVGGVYRPVAKEVLAA